MLEPTLLEGVHLHDTQFVIQQLYPFSDEHRTMLMEEYRIKSNRREANTFLRETAENISKALNGNHQRIKHQYDEEELRSLAKTRALTSMKLMARLSRSPRKAYLHLCQTCLDDGVSPPSLKQYSITSALKRLCCERWWLRSVRKAQTRSLETTALHLNKVNRFKGIYASDGTVIRRRKQKFHNRSLLESYMAINQFDQSYNLAELADLSVSNPKIRKGELMVRMRGFDNLSKILRHKGAFLTFTCPSKYHRALSISGEENPKWKGLTPLDGQRYLCSVWERIRAKLHRNDISIYGFRIAEPQHDGTPHWHLALFVEPEHYSKLIKICETYANLEDGNEPGAAEHRFRAIEIDPSKGSATGYIAKYISKNINGSDLKEGVYGENPIEAAERVEAWAACWGIRQFQQIGGPSVTVWREMRRLTSTDTEHKTTLEEIRISADSANWETFTSLMGGVFVKRTDQPVKPDYQVVFDSRTGEIKEGYYEDGFVARIKGIIHKGISYLTRRYEWRIEKAGTAFLFPLEFCQ